MDTVIVDDIYKVKKEKIDEYLSTDTFYLTSSDKDKKKISNGLKHNQYVSVENTLGSKGEYKFCPTCKKFRITSCSACGCGHCYTCNHGFTCMPTFNISQLPAINNIPKIYMNDTIQTQQTANIDTWKFNLGDVKLKLKVKLLSDKAIAPSRAEPGSVGYDLHSAEEAILKPHTRKLFKTNVAVEIPEGHYGRVAGRSGISYKNGLDVLGGVIDPSYRGEIGVILYNTSDVEVGIEIGKAIAQLVLEKVSTPEVEVVSELSDTIRGDKGYNSSNR